MPGFFVGKQMVGKRILQIGILLLIVLKLVFFTLWFPKQFYTDPISLENPTINSQASNYVTDSPTIKLQIILRCFFCEEHMLQLNRWTPSHILISRKQMVFWLFPHAE